ncbi:unnamed protein product, partial [marine sediment metagenome]
AITTTGQTITFDEIAADPNDADVVLSGIDGVFKIASVNGANNEDLSFDFDAAANDVAVTSTGVLQIDFGTIGLETDSLDLSGGTITNMAAGGLPDDSVVMDDLDDNGNFTDWTGNWTFATGTFTLSNGAVLGGDLSAASGNQSLDITADTDANDTLKLIVNDTDDGNLEAVVITAGAAPTLALLSTGASTYSSSASTVTVESVVFTGGAMTSVTTLNTGQGAYELYAMDQDVEQADSPTFVGLTLTGAIATPTTITASGLVTGNSFALGDTDYIGITSNEIITFNAAGTIVASGGIFSSTLGIASQTPDIGDPDTWTVSGAGLYGGIYIVTTGAGTMALPAAAVGMNFTVIAESTDIVTIDPAADGYIWLDGAIETQNETIVGSGTVGDMVVAVKNIDMGMGYISWRCRFKCCMIRIATIQSKIIIIGSCANFPGGSTTRCIFQPNHRHVLLLDTSCKEEWA